MELFEVVTSGEVGEYLYCAKHAQEVRQTSAFKRLKSTIRTSEKKGECQGCK